MSNFPIIATALAMVLGLSVTRLLLGFATVFRIRHKAAMDWVPLAWAGVLGGCTVFCSGLPAAVAVFIPGRPQALSRRINRWLGIGFLVGMLIGPLVFFAFVARIVS